MRLLGVSVAIAATVLANPVANPQPATTGVTTTISTPIIPSYTTYAATATPLTPIAPNVLLFANTFEFGYLNAYNFTTLVQGDMFEQELGYTSDLQICKLACGQELVGANQVAAMLLIPGLDLTKTYIIVGGTGGANPKYATAGGVAISTFGIQWE